MLAGCVMPNTGKPLSTGASGFGIRTTTTVPFTPPQPSDFRIDVNIIEKSCYGDYGCNVKYKILPHYLGAPLPDTARFTVVYEVEGCDSAKQANFEVTGTKWNVGAPDWDYCTSPTGSVSARPIQILQ